MQSREKAFALLTIMGIGLLTIVPTVKADDGIIKPAKIQAHQAVEVAEDSFERVVGLDTTFVTSDSVVKVNIEDVKANNIYTGEKKDTLVSTTEKKISTTSSVTPTGIDLDDDRNNESLASVNTVDVNPVIEEPTPTVDNSDMTEYAPVPEDYSGGSDLGYELQYSAPYYVCDNPLNTFMGVKDFNGHKETYYSELVLPGEGLAIPGRHVAEDGTIRDGDGYIVVASDLSYLPRYSVVLTSLGPAKVYDTGCSYGVIDIYVHW